MVFLDDISKVHVIGAGGIGVSAVAKLLAHAGKRVTGSDVAANEATRELETAGIPVAIGHRAANLPADADLVVYSSAVPEDNPERAAARELGRRELSYFQFIGEYSKSKWTIAVSGTNGKSTTTALLGLILEKAGFEPTVIVGSKVRTFPDKNLRLGRGAYFVVEACEHQAHMLELFPQMIVLTNIEEDHLDYYRDLDHIRETFNRYVAKLPPDGVLIRNADDPVSAADLTAAAGSVSYGLKGEADYTAQGLTVGGERQRFEVVRRSGQPASLGEFSLPLPGKFNVYNALAAITAATELGAPADAVRQAVGEFAGLWRRFERVGEMGGALLYSDYGHHPTAVAGTLAAAREFFPDRRLVLAFQPHQHNRTRKLFEEFVVSFDAADVVVLAEIFDVAGREAEADRLVSSADLAEAARKRDAASGRGREVVFAENLEKTAAVLRRTVRRGDVVLLMGAGDIYKLADQLRTN